MICVGINIGQGSTHMEERRNIRTVEEVSDEKIRRHRQAPLYSALLIVVVVLVLVLIAYTQYTNHLYTSYDIIDTGDWPGRPY